MKNKEKINLANGQMFDQKNMSELMKIHFEETKQMIWNKSKEIMSTDSDLVKDSRFFAPIRQKIENLGKTDQLQNLANKRLSDARLIFKDEKSVNKYRDELIYVLRDVVISTI
jgi:hypothetical protein